MVRFGKGDGNAWKRRQAKKPGGMSGQRRGLVPRVLKSEPQFTLDELYISPFTARRQFSDDGEASYVPLERRGAHTGIRVFDDYLNYLARGGSDDMQVFADRHGLRREDVESLVFVLTGMRGIVFRSAFQVRMADDLLRYTDMMMPEVAQRSGIGSANNLYLTYKREFGVAPGVRREQLRQKGDVGRFRL